MICPLCKGLGSVDDPCTDEIGPKVAAARKRMGLTQQDVAERMGCSHALIAMIENGHANIALKKVRRFSRLLGVRVEELVP